MENLAEIGIGLSYLAKFGEVCIKYQEEDTSFAKKGWKLRIGDNYAKSNILVDAINELIAKMEEE